MVSQKYPYPGKLRLRGESALAEASAAGHDVDDMRLQLVESACSAFADYFLVERALVVNLMVRSTQACSVGEEAMVQLRLTGSPSGNTVTVRY